MRRNCRLRSQYCLMYAPRMKGTVLTEFCPTCAAPLYLQKSGAVACVNGHEWPSLADALQAEPLNSPPATVQNSDKPAGLGQSGEPSVSSSPAVSAFPCLGDSLPLPGGGLLVVLELSEGGAQSIRAAAEEQKQGFAEYLQQQFTAAIDNGWLVG